MSSGDCGLAASHPDTAPFYKTKKECVKAADALTKDIAKQTDLLVSGADIPGPWQTKAVCGTPKDAAIVEAFLRGRKVAAQMKLELEHPKEEQESPGDRDPYPDGG